MQTIKCEKCDHYWVIRVESPKKCPKCGKYFTNKPYIYSKPKKIDDEKAKPKGEFKILSPDGI